MGDIRIFDTVSASAMNRRRFLIRTGATALGLAMGSVGTYAASSPTKRSLTIGQYAEPINLNPIMEMVDRPALQIESNIYTPLVYLDFQTGKLLPGLATKWIRKDLKTWVFQLREGIQFHKGFGELTAEDVEFYCNYMIDENKPTVWLFTAVEHARLLDKYTVEYRTKEPFAPLPYYVGMGLGAWIVSKRAYKEMGEETFNRNPVGTGPFEFQSWQRGSQITIRRFDRFWRKGMPYLDELVFRPIPDSFVRASLMKTGDIDLMDAPDYKDVQDFRRDPKVVVRSVPGWNFDYIQLNLDRPPLNVKEVRQAIAYAINREEIARSVYYGEASPGDNALPPGFTFGSPTLQRYPNRADVDKAKALLAKAGFSQGIKVTCITSERPSARRTLELIASQLAKVGITVEIQNLETGTYQSRWRKGDFDLATEFIVIATPDPDSAFWQFYHTGTRNSHGYANRMMDQLLDTARSEPDERKRRELYRRIVTLAEEDVPFIYMTHGNVVRIAKRGLTGVPITPQEIYLPLEQVRWE